MRSQFIPAFEFCQLFATPIIKPRCCVINLVVAVVLTAALTFHSLMEGLGLGASNTANWSRGAARPSAPTPPPRGPYYYPLVESVSSETIPLFDCVPPHFINSDLMLGSKAN